MGAYDFEGADFADQDRVCVDTGVKDGFEGAKSLEDLSATPLQAWWRGVLHRGSVIHLHDVLNVVDWARRRRFAHTAASSGMHAERCPAIHLLFLELAEAMPAPHGSAPARRRRHRAVRETGNAGDVRW